MGIWEDLGRWWDPGKDARAAAGNVNLPYFQEDRAQLQGQLAQGSPYSQASQVGANPYGRDNRALVSQLQRQAMGVGPSLAEGQYRSASQDSMAQQAALSHVGGAAGARQAALNQGRIQQGLTQGVTQARTAEQLGALGQLQGALGMAGQAEFGRDALNAQLRQQTGGANQAAYLDMLAKQYGLSAEQLRALIGQGQLQLGAAGLPNGIDRLFNAGAGTAGIISGWGNGQPGQG